MSVQCQSTSPAKRFYFISALTLLTTLLLLPPAQAQSAPQARVPATAPIFTVLPARGVINRFKLVRLLSAEFQKDKKDVADFRDTDFAIVFEGNTTLGEEIDVARLAGVKKLTPLEKAIVHKARLIVVNGDLNCSYFSTGHLTALFVLGNVNCDDVYLSTEHLYVQGNLNARIALSGGAEDDEGTGSGAFWVNVKGTVFSPSIRTWYLKLDHLKMAPGAGKEVIVQDVEPDSSGP